MKRLLKRVALTAWNTILGPIVVLCTAPVWVPLWAMLMFVHLIRDEWKKTK